ncbi:BamA/TamA family outer membrane protein [Gammaproteobacteria bacterium]|nr:BamA/TamA family outer membrane protein [Gammaproteobacteria bacterium]
MRSKTRNLRNGLLWLWICCAVIPGLARASLDGVSADVIGLPIDHFRVSGNIKTQEKYLIQWSELHIGQQLSLPVLNNALQELRDTDLFLDIQFQTERHENGELVLHIIVEERRYWLLLPRLSRNSEGDIKSGFRLRMYNLQGADQTLDLLAQQEEESDGDDSRELRFTYKLPLFEKPYDLTWQLGHIIKNTEEEGFDNVETINYASFGVSRDWNLDRFEIPLTVASSIALGDLDLKAPYPESIEAREAGMYNRLRLGLIFDDVHRERYRRFGSYYAIALEQGFEWLGSDYESTVVGLEINKFVRLNRYDNFNSRFVLEIANDSPFDYPRYGIGGASNIRGLEDIDERGDARWFANLEYIFAYMKHPGVAHTLFVDFGNIYDDLEDIDVGDLHYTVGSGFRWKIESFVKTDLFLDYGYDVEGQQGKIYGGTSLNF